METEDGYSAGAVVREIKIYKQGEGENDKNAEGNDHAFISQQRFHV